MKDTLALIGTQYRPAGREIVREMESSHPVLLVREPNNQHDPNAIAVYVQIGYVPRGQAAVWAPQMDCQVNLIGTCKGVLINGSKIEVET